MFVKLLLHLILFINLIEPIHHRKKPPCQLPPFTNMLPLNSRRELRKIWSGFHSTTVAKKCERQLAQTKQLIEKLSDDMKLKVLDWDKPQKPEPERFVSGTNFLAGLSDEQTHQFSEIMSNRSISHEMRFDLLRNWASEYLDLDATNQVEQFIVFLQRKNKSFKEKIEKLSSEARIAHDKLESLRRLKQEVYSNLTDAAKQELANLYRTKCPKGSVYEASDLDAEEIQLACSVDERMPLIRTTTTTTSTTTTTQKPIQTTTTQLYGEDYEEDFENEHTTYLPPRDSVKTRRTPARTTAMPSSTPSMEPLWMRLTTRPTRTTSQTARLSFEIEKSNSKIPLIPSRPDSMASLFVANPERLTDLLKKIFNTRTLK